MSYAVCEVQELWRGCSLHFFHGDKASIFQKSTDKTCWGCLLKHSKSPSHHSFPRFPGAFPKIKHWLYFGTYEQTKRYSLKSNALLAWKKNKPQTVNITNPWEHVLKLLFLCYIFCKSFLLSLLLTTNSHFQILVCFFKWLAPFELDLSVFYPCSPVSILFPDDIHSFKNLHRKGLLSDTIPQYFSEQDCPSKCDS